MKNSLLDLKLIHIEICSFCNLQCVHCYRTTNNYPSKNKYMDKKLFFKIVDEVKKEDNELTLQMHGIGEPTLHPNLLDFLSYAKKSNKFSKIFITTNLLATNPENIIVFIDNGLDLINISVDSLQKETLNKMRKGTDPEKLLHNLKVVANKYSQKMQITTVVGKDNVDDLDQIADVIDSLNIKTWILQPLIYWDDFLHDEKQNQKIIEKMKYLKEKFTSRVNIGSILSEEKKSRCNMPFEMAHINPRGYVMPCCMFWDEQIINFGNIKDDNLYDVLENPEFIEFRENFFKTKPEICKNCYSY